MQVFLIAAMTLDGYIARSATERSFDWTTPEDKVFYISKIKEAMHMVLGSTTLKTFSKFPRGMTCYIYTRHPKQFSREGLSQAAVFEPTNEPPQALVQRLKAAGVEKLAICGGATIYSQFLAAGVVNKIYLTIEPILFGQGVRLFSNEVMEQRLQLVKSEKLNDTGTVLVEYDVLPSTHAS